MRGGVAAKWIGFPLAVLAVAGLLGMAAQRWAVAADRAALPPPGRLVSVGSYRLHILCKGAGPGPTVVMVAGGGTPAVVSYALQDRIAHFARVCSYDRAGLGWSDPAPHRLSFGDQVGDLKTLLTNAHVPRPYLFVPESFGSLIVIRFANLHPAETAGVVFVDGVDPKLWFGAMPKLSGFSAHVKNALFQAAWRVGIIRLAFPFLAPHWVWRLPPHLRAEMTAIYSRASPGYAEALEAFEVSMPSQRPQLAPGELGKRPVVVISHGVGSGLLPPAFRKGWSASQTRLRQWSSCSAAAVAAGANHEVAQEAPDLVASWVHRALDWARRGTCPGR